MNCFFLAQILELMYADLEERYHTAKSTYTA